MASLRKYNKICLFCRKDYIAQKRNTKYCSLPCAQKAYKLNAKKSDFVEVNFEEYVKRSILIQGDILTQIQMTLSELLKQTKFNNREYLSSNDFCDLNKISRKTLSNWIREGRVEVNAISNRKILVKNKNR